MDNLLRKVFRKSSQPLPTHVPARVKRFSLFSRYQSSAGDHEPIEQSVHSTSTTQPCTSLHSKSSILLATSNQPTAQNATQSCEKIANISPADEQDLVWRGIQYHERDELEKATQCWQQAAEEDIPLGHYFYGMALRHGWGCKKEPREAVKHLQKAAQCAVFDLQTGHSNSSPIVAKSELVSAIYELAVCFQQGWGTSKDLKTAAHFFEIAANLGDADAQNALAFCYERGEGVKKDKYRAAKYYRLADQQGAGQIGNSWIWKDKYCT